MRPVAVERQVPDLEREQLRPAHARRGEQLEHFPMAGVDEGDDELHRAAKEWPRQLVIIVDVTTVRQNGL